MMKRRQILRAMRGLIIANVGFLASAGPSSAGIYSAANVPELIAAIDAANQNAEPDSIALAAGATFTLTEVNNSTSGPTGLPTIAATGVLSIFGNGGVIERSRAAETPSFRLFDVAAGAALQLENLTLQGGRLYGSQVLTSEASAKGGAILNQGDLALHNVTVQDSVALGHVGYYARGYSAAGGGIYSSGSLTMEGGVIQNNQALGGLGGHAFVGRDGASGGGPGGHGWGGGLYVEGGTATLNRVTFSSNTVQGGAGGNGATFLSRGQRIATAGGRGGDGSGGALYAAGGTITLYDGEVNGNTASGGAGGRGGAGPPPGATGSAGVARGDGLFIETDSLTRLDEPTFTHVTSNSPSNFYGPFEVLPTPVPGDYNADGTVDAADYVLWRKNDGTQAGYNTWRANFGHPSGSGSVAIANATVPEPATLVLLIVAAVGVSTLRRCRTWPVSKLNNM